MSRYLYITESQGHYEVGQCDLPDTELIRRQKSDPTLRFVRCYRFNDPNSIEVILHRGDKVAQALSQWHSVSTESAQDADVIADLYGGVRFRLFEG